ncbi:MAG: GspE/PulE family protein, partial [Bdellovibrionales bacterium]
MATPSKTSLDSILLKGTSFSKEELSSVFSTKLASGETVGKVLREKTFKTANEAVGNLSELIGIDFMEEVPFGEISGDLVRNIPINYAKTNGVIPYKEEKEELFVFSSNPLNFNVLDDLRVLFNKKVTPIMATSVIIQEAINKVYEKSTSGLDGFDEVSGEEYDLEDPVIDLLEAGEDDAPVIKLVNSLLFRAVKEKASDIHIEPYEKDMMVRFRIDGVLFDIFKPPKKLQNAITSRIKVMANLNIAEKRLPQDGRIPLKLAGKDIDVRLSTVPTAFGERVVMRLQDRSNVILDLQQLGFSDSSLKEINSILEKTYGILLVTGPTGSGKST